MHPPIQILRQYFGHESFRPLQEEIIQTVLEGRDCLALLPTGGGKSVCFQVPTLAAAGRCLVISPLIALMKDQVENLRRRGIPALAIHSGMSRGELLQTLRAAIKGPYRFIYLSPERLETTLFRDFLPELRITLIAVDEAHCISQWGYDFRPAYQRIAQLREDLPGVPVLALTASATPEVCDDICLNLKFSNHRIFRQSFARPALSYSVFRAPSKLPKLREILEAVPGTGIVYCGSRRRTKSISDLLQMHGISADYFHAGLSPEERSKKQDQWLSGKIRIMVCTNAFGMGIDKPDVRTVVHVDPPDCLERYYQEAGRAGRDGQKAYAVLLYSEEDLEQLRKLPAVRYPPISRIRQVYGSLMNHLQIPAGAGEGQYFALDPAIFREAFGIEARLFEAVLTTLEQEGVLSFSEQVLTSARMQILANRQDLESFQAMRPQESAVLTAMLRTCEGVFDQPVPVPLLTISRASGLSPAQTEEALHLLQREGIARYFPLSGKSQIRLNGNRVAAADLFIDPVRYSSRKKRFTGRLHAMLAYVDGESCRSAYIGNYFGDKEIADCGICDICLERKKRLPGSAVFQQIHERILALINNAPRPVDQVLKGLGDVPREHAWEVIRFLESERALSVTAKGWLQREDKSS